MDKNRILQIFKSTGALLNGHFLLTSGLHSPQYLEKFKVLQYPGYTTMLCREIARRFSKNKVDVVIGPATGGIILAHEVGRQLKTRAVFMERENGKLKLRRGFKISKAERVLVVEDIVTTGGSVKELIKELKKTRCKIVGIGLLVDRSGKKKKLFNFRTETLIKLNIKTYKPENCPFCKSNIPVTGRGSKHLK